MIIILIPNNSPASISSLLLGFDINIFKEIINALKNIRSVFDLKI
jgi:hypothetical protein